MGKGVLRPITGFAEFIVVYQALILRVFKNMVVDSLVTTVNQVRRTPVFTRESVVHLSKGNQHA